MVCVSFDDAIATQYSAAQAKLDAYNIRATFYTIWDLIGTATYMTEANVIELGNK